MRTREFVCRLEKFINILLNKHLAVDTVPSEHTGTFVSPTEKIGSIGLQLRHRITSHGFAINIEKQVEPWFENITVCGLADVKGISAESCRRNKGLEPLSVPEIVPLAVESFSEAFERPVVPLATLASERDPKVLQLISATNAASSSMQ
jgi:lipoate-protein ligase B